MLEQCRKCSLKEDSSPGGVGLVHSELRLGLCVFGRNVDTGVLKDVDQGTRPTWQNSWSPSPDCRERQSWQSSQGLHHPADASAMSSLHSRRMTPLLPGLLGGSEWIKEGMCNIATAELINWSLSRCCYPLNHLTLFLSYQPRCKHEETGCGKEGLLGNHPFWHENITSPVSTDYAI